MHNVGGGRFVEEKWGTVELKKSYMNRNWSSKRGLMKPKAERIRGE